jgi:hypothetical protein
MQESNTSKNCINYGHTFPWGYFEEVLPQPLLFHTTAK